MDKDKKRYVHFDPAQINNYGSGENSVQTISRKVKEKMGNPMDTVDEVVGGLNSLWSFLFKSIPYFVVVTIIPFIICGCMGVVALHYALNPNPNLSWLLSESYTAIGRILGHIPSVFSILLPYIIIISCAILCLALSTLVAGSILYPNNSRGRRNFFTAMFGAQVGLFLYSLAKSDKE